MNQGLDIGRHYRVNMVITNHLPSNGKDTRRVLNEASSFTYFAHSANAKIKYSLENYVGIDKKMISYFKKQNTRAVTIFKQYTMVYLTDHEIGLVNAFWRWLRPMMFAIIYPNISGKDHSGRPYKESIASATYVYPVNNGMDHNGRPWDGIVRVFYLRLSRY